ncbi:uncharacterized protein LOC120283996 [Dioscorea cayenensis subsp. rotundata]|uniref:Uncharacterized protein LOC120283996 n=1 Tax=Dioscorea cayennensis subsp. rotundata TaxID=55577 RepID=A0AB40D7L6_DIOCR|nr:uncharacterized protein LOC120283996 [Dioscorea cayenensis subsp. rotundata]
MASGGQPPPPSMLSKTWANVAAAAQRKPSSPLVEDPVLSKLKANTTEFIRVDHDTLSRARMRFQTALYGKFFGKSPPFEQVKEILSEKWAKIGTFHISDLPNEYLLIWCDNQEAMNRLMFEGPWAVNSIVLQLAPWPPFFEPAFTKLSTVAIWIDDVTYSLSRSKFARIYIEIDLAKPLKQGFWIRDNEHRIFVVALYERLPTFCYKCGHVGHGSNNYNRQSSEGSGHPSPPHRNDLNGQQ